MKPNHIYGESLHVRGSNINEIEFAISDRIILYEFDSYIEKAFYNLLEYFRLTGTWWKDYKKVSQ